MFAPPDPKQQDDRRRLIQLLTEQKEKLERELAGAGTGFSRCGSWPGRPAQLQAVLPLRTVLVDFLEYEHSSPSPLDKGKWTYERRMAAFVVAARPAPSRGSTWDRSRRSPTP